MSGDTEQIVFASSGGSHVTDAGVEARISAMLRKVARVPHVTEIASPYGPGGTTHISKDRTVAFASVTFDEQAQNLSVTVADDLVTTAQSARALDLEVAVSGQLAEQTNKPSIGGVGIGVIAAGLVLLLVFGSLFSMALPLVSALLSLGTAIGLIGLLSHVMKMPMFAPELVLLIGLGVGVDYALFIVTRHRQGLLDGLDTESAIVTAIDTSGRAVLFAGIIVCIALLGMFALGVSFLYGLAISAALASVPASAPRPHPDAVPGDFIRIDVSDTGCGIPDILRGQIFDPFFTTKGVGRGSGLGLSTARSIVKSHRGFITFVSAENAGTTFSVFLPTAESGLSQAVRGSRSRSPIPIPRGKGEHVLVVDDEESVRLIMRSSLEAFGFRVTTASDGAEAVALLRNPATQFDLAVVDMQMPGMGGGKTIVALRHLRPDLPIVGASGMATSENREHAAANGVRHFLDKPFSVETLIRTAHVAMVKTAT